MIFILLIQQQGKEEKKATKKYWKLKTGKTKKYNFSSNFRKIEWETSVFCIFEVALDWLEVIFTPYPRTHFV